MIIVCGKYEASKADIRKENHALFGLLVSHEKEKSKQRDSTIFFSFSSYVVIYGIY